jgi:hypothetical protein
MLSLVIYALALALPTAYFLSRYFSQSPTPPAPVHTPPRTGEKPLKTIMQAPRADLLPPKDDPFTPAELAAFDGSDPTKPIYVAIKGVCPRRPCYSTHTGR